MEKKIKFREDWFEDRKGLKNVYRVITKEEDGRRRVAEVWKGPYCIIPIIHENELSVKWCEEHGVPEVEGNAYKVAYGKAKELSKETGLPVTKWDIVIENGGVCVYDTEDDEKPKEAKEEEKKEEKPTKKFTIDDYDPSSPNFGDAIDALLEDGFEIPKISFHVCDDICEEASDWAGLFSGE
ncbi:hypothetical protein SAMN06265339_0673 [Desulfurobacterium pacificum]|uniref:Uncharacterized protein n=1 Tax=Desulfurobacterium pacificum TaxID=240166 RepID=A0ABY1NG96_9BACT|nr:hypothetical protein [Desulfurobacterium pacificum]SMP08968.1 hypothetical protein SAMN06265339_0673 [Desulfurobacterium pacificum]